MGSAHPLNAPYQAFQTKDGWITIGAATQPNWLRLLDVLRIPELAEDARFATNATRMRHLAELEAALTPVFRQRPSAEWLELLDHAAVPAGPVFDILQMHADEQTLAREMIVETTHSRIGAVKSIGLPVKLSDTPGEVRRGAPVYGEHTREVLREHGFSDAEIERMAEAGAIHLA
jgi:crotonobetainyl-CoA:carnitine CoA-transferase CaiB-like acyl-CoA transferase